MAGIPALAFSVMDAGALEHAATPTLRFEVRIDAGTTRVRSLSLNVQVVIEAAVRRYDDETRERMRDLVGGPAESGRSLRALHWTQAAVVVPGFEGSTEAQLRVPCTYDFEVAAAKYLDAVRDGVIPLGLQFSGSIFYDAGKGMLQVARVPWDAEARYALPASAWHELMDRYFPNSAWLRVRSDVFDRLNAWRSERGLPGWDAALEALLQEARG